MLRESLFLKLTVMVNGLMLFTFFGCGTGNPKPPVAAPVPGVATTPSGGSSTPTPAVASPPSTTAIPPSAPPIDVAKTEPVVKLAAEEFLASGLKDPLATDAQYEGKVIQLQGNVRSLHRRIAKGSVESVSLGLNANKDSFDSVTCRISDLDAWKNVASNSQIAIKGRWAAFQHFPGTKNPQPRLGSLLDCVIVEASPCPRITIMPDQLAEDFNMLGEEGFEAKYSRKDLLVEGEVEGYATATDGVECVIFKSASPLHIGFHPNPAQKQDPIKMKVRFPIGQRVAFIGNTNRAYTTAKRDTVFVQEVDIVDE